MTETHGLPESVLSQAAEAFLNEFYEYGGGMKESTIAGISAALPILTTAMLERMIADANRLPQNWSFLDANEAVLDFLRTYIPTTTESEDDHE